MQLIEPLEYLPFVRLMAEAELILTDSGGVQEEAPSLGKRVVVLRDETERTEGLETGLIRLAGTDPEKVVGFALDALEGRWPLADRADVYGDGRASERIIDAIAAHSPL
ncbi:UDP-N-acetylglucosamine 2-epimerase [Methylomonas koyamae]|uniref:UDP-N-acetylglucosamine 2-epimerase n=1 Tax=Methylomonas koyamae TaxID=702114 RepID=UPI000A452F23|nr:UDP-N-acetylglucosamine 2-epimerase [Methylomonas koyamae]